MHKNIALLFFISMLMLALTACNNEPRVYTTVAGAWVCEEFDRNGTRRFIVEIENVEDGIIISNLYNTGMNEIALAKYSNQKITLNANQPIGFTSVILRSGSGNVSADFRTIALKYQVSDNSQIIDVTANLSRQ